MRVLRPRGTWWHEITIVECDYCFLREYMYTHTHTHTHTQVYIYVDVCIYNTICIYPLYKVGDVTAVRVFHPRGTAGAWREGALRGRDVGGGRDGQKSGERPSKRQRTEGDGVRIDPKYKFLRFTLFKENRDTMGGIAELCRYTSLAPKKFSYAGTKDRRACTAQYVTVHRADSRPLLQVNRKIHFGLVLGNFVYCQVRPLTRMCSLPRMCSLRNFVYFQVMLLICGSCVADVLLLCC